MELLKKEHIAAFFLEYPIFKRICADREVSAVFIRPAPEILNFGPPCANGFNCTGWAYGIKDGKIVSEFMWDDIRQKQKEFGLRSWEATTAQLILTGEEDAFVFVQEHREEGNHTRKYISMDVFMCRKNNRFNSYLDVKAWMFQPFLKKEMQKITT